MKPRKALFAATVLLGTAAPVLAHHSFAAQYDAAQPVEMRGTVTQVEWTNPHARFYIDVRDAKGVTTNWNFELASPNVLARNGWKRSTLTKGDEIVVAGFLARVQPSTGSQMAIASAVTTVSGTKLFAASNQDGR
jgi:hypothetical protein